MLRRRLAEVYRLYGDAAEAGRWMYLEDDRNADETAAFEDLESARRADGQWVADQVLGPGASGRAQVGGLLPGEERHSAGQGAFRAGDGDEPGGGFPLVGEGVVQGVGGESVGFVLGVLGAGEAFAVGALDLVLGHPDGVVAG